MRPTRIQRLAAVAVLLAVSAASARAEDPPAPPAGTADGPAPAKEEREEKEPAPIPEVFVLGRAEQGAVPKVPLDAVGSRDVLGPEVIRPHPARDLNDLVRLLPALSTRPYNGGEAAAPSFSLRGLPDDGLTEYLLVLVDGVPASSLPYGWTALSFAPVARESVYAIDFIRGGHAVRYSPNTVGGVLNFITEPVPEDRTFRLEATLGSNDYRSTLLSYGDSSEAGGFLFTGVDRSGDGFRDDGGFAQRDLSLKGRIVEKGKGWYEVRLSHFFDEHQAPGGLTPAQYEADRFANARPINRFRGFRGVVDLVAHRDLSKDSWLEGFAYGSETGRRYTARRPQFGAATSILDWEDESLFWGAGARGSAKARALGLDHEVYGGVRAHLEDLPSRTIDSRPVAGGPRTRTTDSEFDLQAYSVHLDDTVRPLPGVTVTAGARLEWVPDASGSDAVAGRSVHHDFLGVLPGVGASWKPVDWGALYGNWHRSFRPPQVWGFDFAGNDQDLDFEKGDNREAGVRIEGPAGVSGNAAFWWTRFDDVGVYYSGFYENLGAIDARGTDLALRWEAGRAIEALDGLELHGSWTRQDSTLEEGPSKGNDTPYAWHDKAAWGARVRTGGWTFGVDGTRVGPSFSDEANTRVENATGNLGRNRSVILWDASVSRAVPLGEAADLSLGVGVSNLFDAERYVHSRGGFFGGGRVPYAPRQVFLTLGLTVEF